MHITAIYLNLLLSQLHKVLLVLEQTSLCLKMVSGISINIFIPFLYFTVPSSPPTNASVSIINSRSIFISWFPPPFDHQNGLIREYEIMIEEIETGIIYNDTSLNLYIQIDYIHPHYTYNISISAVTISSGPYTTAVTIQTPQDSKSKTTHFKIRIT